MMKKIVTFSLFIFLSGLTGILIAGFLVSKQEGTAEVGTNGVEQVAVLPVAGDALISSATSSVVSQVKSVEMVLSASEVSKHNSANDCWQIVNNKVYNFTPYINQHPGGSGTIIPFCGKEATAAFSDKGGQGNNHSDFAWKLLSKYVVGDLNQKIGVVGAGSAQVQSDAKSTAVTPTVQSGAPAQVSKPAAPVKPGGNGVVLTAVEAAKHNTSQSCWLIVSGKIYDVSGYLSKHPAGASAITPYCGKESTSAFTGSGGGHVHSGFASGLLNQYYIGAIGQQTTTSAVEQSTQQAQSAAQQAPTGGGEEEEEDED